MESLTFIELAKLVLREEKKSLSPSEIWRVVKSMRDEFIINAIFHD